MRGHGFVATGRSPSEVVRLSVMLPRNARIDDGIRWRRTLSPGEVALRKI